MIMGRESSVMAFMYKGRLLSGETPSGQRDTCRLMLSAREPQPRPDIIFYQVNFEEDRGTWSMMERSRGKLLGDIVRTAPLLGVLE